MGKHRHSKDKSHITATEWAECYGGKKTVAASAIQPLAFDHCGLSLTKYTTPVCLGEGVIFEHETLIEYILKYKKNPITGDQVSVKDIIRLNMDKSPDGRSSFVCSYFFARFLTTYVS